MDWTKTPWMKRRWTKTGRTILPSLLNLLIDDNWWIDEAYHPRKKKFFKFLTSPAKKIQNQSYPKNWELYNMIKNERQINSNLPCRFGHFLRELTFWAPETFFLNGRSAHNFFQYTAHLLCRESHFWGKGMRGGRGGGRERLCIFAAGKQPNNFRYGILTVLNIFRNWRKNKRCRELHPHNCN